MVVLLVLSGLSGIQKQMIEEQQTSFHFQIDQRFDQSLIKKDALCFTHCERVEVLSATIREASMYFWGQVTWRRNNANNAFESRRLMLVVTGCLDVRLKPLIWEVFAAF